MLHDFPVEVFLRGLAASAVALVLAVAVALAGRRPGERATGRPATGGATGADAADLPLVAGTRWGSLGVRWDKFNGSPDDDFRHRNGRQGRAPGRR